MFKFNFDKLKTQVLTFFIEEFWNGLSFIELVYPMAIVLCGFLPWMTGGHRSYCLLGVIVLAFLLFAILKRKTNDDNKMQKPELPVLVFEKIEK